MPHPEAFENPILFMISLWDYLWNNFVGFIGVLNQDVMGYVENFLDDIVNGLIRSLFINFGFRPPSWLEVNFDFGFEFNIFEFFTEYGIGLFVYCIVAFVFIKAVIGLVAEIVDIIL